MNNSKIFEQLKADERIANLYHIHSHTRAKFCAHCLIRIVAIRWEKISTSSTSTGYAFLLLHQKQRHDKCLSQPMDSTLKIHTHIMRLRFCRHFGVFEYVSPLKASTTTISSFSTYRKSFACFRPWKVWCKFLLCKHFEFLFILMQVSLWFSTCFDEIFWRTYEIDFMSWFYFKNTFYVIILLHIPCKGKRNFIAKLWIHPLLNHLFYETFKNLTRNTSAWDFGKSTNRWRSIHFTIFT